MKESGMSSTTDTKILMATAKEGFNHPSDPTKSTIRLTFSREDGIDAEFELEAVAAAMLQFTLGFALKPLTEAMKAKKEAGPVVPDSPEGL